MVNRIILDQHIIYGTWDSNRSQVLVHYHPNGKDATVFILDGQDYGGGIDKVVNTTSAVIDKAAEESDNDYIFYRKMREL